MKPRSTTQRLRNEKTAAVFHRRKRMKPTDISGYEIGGIMLSNEELKSENKGTRAQITQDYAGKNR